MEAGLMIAVSQILDGEGATCPFCGDVATVTVSTGADPNPEPMCWKHADLMVMSTLATGRHLFAVQPPEPATP